MRIQKSVVKDFQALADVKLDHSGLTVIYGQSDVGKSAFIRALYMLCRNQGAASSIRHGSSLLQVFFKTDSGEIVGIQKGQGVNKYFKKSGTAEEEVFAKVGKEVPRSIADILNLDLLPLDKDQNLDLNFSLQFDSPFLITDSQVSVTKAISAVSGISLIYGALREAQAEHVRLSHKISKDDELIAKFQPLTELQDEAEKLERLSRDFLNEEKNVDKAKSVLLQLQKDLESLNKNLSKASIVFDREDSLLANLYTEKKSLEAELLSLASMERFLSSFPGLQQKLLLDSGGIALLLGSLNSLDSLLKDFYKQTSDLTLMGDLYKRFNKAISELSVLDSAIENTEIREKELSSQIKICPTCKRPL